MVMRAFDMSGPILNFVQKMYMCPTARLVTSDFMSPDIPLTKGKHEGCPLSPLLFNITIEPLSRILNSPSGAIKPSDRLFLPTAFSFFLLILLQLLLTFKICLRPSESALACRLIWTRAKSYHSTHVCPEDGLTHPHF